MKRGKIIFVLIGMLLFSFVSLSYISSVGEATFCCEKTTSGAWCQNAPESECNPDYAMAPSLCESTSFCQIGVCIDTTEGICAPSTPQSTCAESGGVWDERPIEEIPQCQLGCCLVGDQAAFVTKTRCKQISSDYGLETNYREDITSESECIGLAVSDVKGACVIDKETEKDCKMVTKRECQDIAASEGDNSKVEFYEGFLCTNKELNTRCGPSEQTTCLEGKDEVYFLDTCGNIANIYDSSRAKDPLYWEKIIKKSESCGFGDPNKDSASCGNCDYFLGSTCSQTKKGNVDYGTNICKSLDCTYTDAEGKTVTRKHGESWCAESSPGVSKIISGEEGNASIGNVLKENLPGSRYFRRVCYNGEVTTEPCADFRNEVCIESQIQTKEGPFSNAACRVNRWQDCSAQKTKTECQDIDKRDCVWIEGERFDGKVVFPDDEEKGSCVPRYSPGFSFWDQGEGTDNCQTASTECLVTYEKGIFGSKSVSEGEECMTACREREGCGFLAKIFNAGECISNCEQECTATCVDSQGNIKKSWLEKRAQMCYALGDCGVKVNYKGYNGEYKNVRDFVTRSKEGSENSNGNNGGTAPQQNSPSIPIPPTQQ